MAGNSKMNVHNIMEEMVTDRVNALYDEVKKLNAVWLTCDCENCRLDTICYVLNRISPRYVVGGRGVTHNRNMINENNQISIDMDKLCLEGMRLVNTAKRPYHQNGLKRAGAAIEVSTAEFNFPTFMGNVYDGTTFEPLSGATVKLSLDGELVEMVDSTWQNPCQTYEATKGSYNFWMASHEAVSEGMNKKFNFTVEVSCPGYATVTYSFTVPLTSEKTESVELNSTYSVKIQDIFLFKEEEE